MLHGAKLAPDDRLLVSTSWRNNITLVTDTRTGVPVFTPGIKLPDNVLSFSISPDSRRIVLGLNNSEARTLGLRTGLPLCPPLKHIMMVKEVAFDASARRVLIRGSDQAARVWDLASSQDEVSIPFLPQDGQQTSNPQGTQLLLVSTNGKVRLVTAKSRQTLHELQHENAVTYASFSPDGRMILTACAQRDVLSSLSTSPYRCGGSTGIAPSDIRNWRTRTCFPFDPAKEI